MTELKVYWDGKNTGKTLEQIVSDSNLEMQEESLRNSEILSKFESNPYASIPIYKAFDMFHEGTNGLFDKIPETFFKEIKEENRSYRKDNFIWQCFLEFRKQYGNFGILGFNTMTGQEEGALDASQYEYHFGKLYHWGREPYMDHREAYEGNKRTAVYTNLSIDPDSLERVINHYNALSKAIDDFGFNALISKATHGPNISIYETFLMIPYTFDNINKIV